MPNDPVQDDNDESLGTSKSSSRKGSAKFDSDAGEYKYRLNRANEKISKLLDQAKELKTRNADLLDRAETVEAEKRSTVKDTEKLVKDAQDLLAKEQAKSEALDKQVKKLTSAQEASALIANKYSVLLPDHMAGDLKVRTDFETDEAYEAYLDRQSKRLGATASAKTEVDADAEGTQAGTATEVNETEEPDRDGLGQEQRSFASASEKRKYLAGSLPNSGVRVRQANEKSRSRAQIADEMMKLDAVKDKERYDALFAEMDKAKD